MVIIPTVRLPAGSAARAIENLFHISSFLDTQGLVPLHFLVREVVACIHDSSDNASKLDNPATYFSSSVCDLQDDGALVSHVAFDQLSDYGAVLFGLELGRIFNCN